MEYAYSPTACPSSAEHCAALTAVEPSVPALNSDDEGEESLRASSSNRLRFMLSLGTIFMISVLVFALLHVKSVSSKDSVAPSYASTHPDHGLGFLAISPRGWQPEVKEELYPAVNPKKIGKKVFGDFCNPNQTLPGPVHPRKIEPTGQWAELCKTEWHDGRWVPPADWGSDAERNWCWVFMKMSAENHRFDAGMNEKPPNWWGAQANVAGKGLAPDPWAQVLLPLLNHEVCDIQPNGQTVSNAQYSAWSRPTSEWLEAGNWFNANVQVYVLNLPQNVQRMATMSARLGQLGIPFTRIDGIDLRQDGALDEAKQKGLVPLEWNLTQATNVLKAQFGAWSPVVGQIGVGTAGCSAAHINAMTIASKSEKPLAIILEDDTYLNDDFLMKFRALLRDEVPCDWEAINLDLYLPYGECISPHLARVHPDGNEPAESCRKGSSWSFAAMLYRVSSLSTIVEDLRPVTFNMSRPACLVHDMAFASLADRINYYAVPAQQNPGFVSSFHVAADFSREAINR